MQRPTGGAGYKDGGSQSLRTQGGGGADLRRLSLVPGSPQEAIALDPKNPLARFERAAVLMSLDMPEQVRICGGGC